MAVENHTTTPSVCEGRKEDVLAATVLCSGLEARVEPSRKMQDECI